MYKLSLDNEELQYLKNAINRAIIASPSRDETETLQNLYRKLVVAQINAEDEALEEAEGQRYAMNLHSRPEGA